MAHPVLSTRAWRPMVTAGTERPQPRPTPQGLGPECRSQRAHCLPLLPSSGASCPEGVRQGKPKVRNTQLSAQGSPKRPAPALAQAALYNSPQNTTSTLDPGQSSDPVTWKPSR